MPYSFAKPREIGAIMAETPQVGQTNAAWFPIPPSGTRLVTCHPASQSRYPPLAIHEFTTAFPVPRHVADIVCVVTAVHPRP